MVEAEKLPLEPECRALDEADGVPVVLGDGNTWLLHDGGLRNVLDSTRDELFDQSTLQGQVDMPLVCLAAEWLLRANYDLEPVELITLVYQADHQALTDAVFLALFGPLAGKKTYTDWATSALLANGLDPAKIPVALMPDVLTHLEASRRCVPRGQFIDSANAAPKLAAARARAARRAIPPEPTPDPEPTTEPAPEELAHE